ncbi:unnamed protein product [Symbiodinium natans]|uniref:Uncharacterized protein n=1 Tax=Symbiodinium natans TaxID=878477 RepID=A0A812P3A6_9DINO|nr:unnamed protein product [Symbiodinium natans]
MYAEYAVPEEDLHIRRTWQHVLLQNLVTGELVVLKDTQSCKECDLLAGPRGFVIRLVDLDGEKNEMPAHEQLRYEKVADQIRDKVEGTTERWTTAAAAVKGCAIKWLVAFCGGHQNKNFVGASSESWHFKVGQYLAALEGEEEDLGPEELRKRVQIHFVVSRKVAVAAKAKARSRKRKQPEEEEEEDEGEEQQVDESAEADPGPAGEYSASFFTIGVLLLHWSTRKLHERSRWKGSKVEAKEARLNITVQSDSVQLDWPSFCRSDPTESLECLAEMMPTGERDFCECLQQCCKQEVNPNFTLKKRRACQRAVALLLQCLCHLIEASRMDDIWKETELWQIQPLRTGMQGLFVM